MRAGAIVSFAIVIAGCGDQGSPTWREWTFSVDTLRSQLDKSEKLAHPNLWLSGSRNEGRDRDEVALNVRCSPQTGWSVSVILGEGLNTLREPRYRIDNGKTVTMNAEDWTLGSSDKDKAGFILALGGKAEAFVQSLSSAKQLFVEYYPSSDVQPRLAAFEVAGLSAPLQRFSTACSVAVAQAKLELLLQVNAM